MVNESYLLINWSCKVHIPFRIALCTNDSQSGMLFLANREEQMTKFWQASVKPTCYTEENWRGRDHLRLFEEIFCDAKHIIDEISSEWFTDFLFPWSKWYPFLTAGWMVQSWSRAVLNTTISIELTSTTLGRNKSSSSLVQKWLLPW